MELFEERGAGDPGSSQGQADSYFASVIYLAARVPAEAAEELGLLESLQRASDSAREAQNGQALGELAQWQATHLELGNRWDQARDVRLAALGSGLALGISAPMLWIGQAQAEQALGSIGQALLYAEKAEAQLFLGLEPNAPGFDLALAQILGVSGELLIVLGLLDQAQQPIGAALVLAEKLGSPALLAAARTRQAALLGAAQQTDALRRLMQSSLADARLGGEERLRAALALRLGICLASRGDPEDSGEQHLLLAAESEYLSPWERFRAQVWLGNLALRKSEFRAARSWLGLAEESLALRPSARPPARELAFLAALWAKLARREGASAELLRERYDLLQAAYEGFLDNWKSTPIRPGGVAFLRYPSRNLILNQWIQSRLLLEPGQSGIEAAFQELHRAQAMGSTARRAEYRVPSLLELRQRLLGPGEGLLVFLPGEDQSHWFALDQSGLWHHPLPPIQELRKNQSNLYARISVQPDREHSSAAEPQLQLALQRMSEQLLPESIRHRLQGWSALTVIGLDTLGYVPMEHLPLGEGRILDDALAISYLQSLPIGMLLLERPDPLIESSELDLYFHGPPLSLGESVRAAAPIRMQEPEWQALSAAFDARRVRRDAGRLATHASLQSKAARTARITQLLTHGLPSDGLVRTVDLWVTPNAPGADDRLTCAEADQLDLGALVVISACNAGLGPLRQGEDGGLGFGGAFLMGGRTRAVVLSPAKLDLFAQYELLPRFYGHLTAGLSPAEALRLARCELRRLPDYGHPYYSLMHVQGLGQRVIFAGAAQARDQK